MKDNFVFSSTSLNMTIRIQNREYHQQNEFKVYIKETKSLYTILKIFRLILQFVGIWPIVKKSKILKIIQLIWILLLLLLIVSTSIEVIIILPATFTFIEKGLYIIESIFNSAIPISIYYVSFVRKKKLLKVYDNFKGLLEKINMCRGLQWRLNTRYYQQLKREILILICVVISYYIVFTWLLIVRNLRKSNLAFYFFWAYRMANFVISFDLCLYWLSLRFISLSYSYLNSILQEFNDGFTISSNNSSFYITNLSSDLWSKNEICTFNCKKLFKVYDIFKTLTDMSYNLDQLLLEVVDIFQIILLLNFLSSCSVLALNFFSVYNYFDNPNLKDLQLFFLRFYRVVVHMFDVIIILWSNNAIIGQVS